MFKKAKDITPLHPGMVDAMGAQLSRQGFKTPEAPAVAEEPVAEVQPETIEESTDGQKSRHADKAEGDKKKPVVTDVTPEIGLITTKDKAAKSVETAVKGASKPTEIKASYEATEYCDCEGSEDMTGDICEGCGKPHSKQVSEGVMKVNDWTGKAPKGIKVKKISSSSLGGDNVEMSGPDAILIAYAVRSLGVDKKAKDLKAVQKELSEDNTNSKSDDGDGLDKVQPKAVKKKFVNRLDKDIDNDGDVDDSDEYLHRRRKAVAKALED